MDPTTATKAQIVYFSHGGGPLPILGDPGHQAMVDFMVRLPEQLRKPEAVLVISAHWEESVPDPAGAPRLLPCSTTTTASPKRPTHSPIRLRATPASRTGSPACWKQRGIPTRIDDRRGFDHGLFIPLKLMYPEADIPCTQLSLIRGLDPAAHVALGAALRELKRENILVVGSGFSFHNHGGVLLGGPARCPTPPTTPSRIG